MTEKRIPVLKDLDRIQTSGINWKFTELLERKRNLAYLWRCKNQTGFSHGKSK